MHSYRVRQKTRDEVFAGLPEPRPGVRRDREERIQLMRQLWKNRDLPGKLRDLAHAGQIQLINSAEVVDGQRGPWRIETTVEIVAELQSLFAIHIEEELPEAAIAVPPHVEELVAPEASAVPDIPSRPLEPPPVPKTVPGVTPPSPRRLWHLRAIGIQAARRQGFTGTGRGVTVAVLDTGVDATHPELQGKVVGAFAIDKAKWRVRRMRQPRDTDGHGTYIAGLICGTSIGVAPDARVLSVEMIPHGHGTLADFVLAMKWVASRKEVAIATICAGLRSYVPILQAACNDLVAIGVLPVVAVGNEGQGEARCPGNCAGVISVGSCSRQGKVSIFSGSSTLSSSIIGERQQSYRVPSLVAPGEQVYSCVSGSRYEVWDGCTPATAIVAGVAALILEKYPHISVVDLSHELLSTCQDLREPAERQGHGLVQVKAVL